MASEDNDDGADPTGDIKAQNPGKATMADTIGADDPHKTEKLAKAGDDGAEAEASE